MSTRFIACPAIVNPLAPRRWLRRLACASLTLAAMNVCSASEPSDGKPVEGTRTARYRLLYNNDTTNITAIASPWHKEGEPFREEMLVASIDEVAGKGVDAYMLSPGMGWVPWWQSKFTKEHYRWWQERTGLEVVGWKNMGNGFDRYVQQGGDVVQLLVETCRKRGIAPFVSLRMNDVHMQENYVLKNQKSLVSCRLYVEHPEWHIDPDHPRRTGYYNKRGMNWAVPAVREYKLELLRELASKYDLAGIELDFMRDDTLFRDGELDDATRIDIISAFVGDVRKALDARPGPRRQLCVRIPLAIRAHAHMGMDVKRLRKAGVDMFNLSCWYDTTQETDVTTVRRLVPDAAIYLEMTHSTGFHPYFRASGGYGTIGNPRTSDEQFYTTARLALRQGVDGFSLFNFAYYRMDAGSDLSIVEPPFHVLSKLSDHTFLDRHPQYYWLAHSHYSRQIPKKMKPGVAQSFRLVLAPPVRDATAKRMIRLRVHTESPLKAGEKFEARINKQSLQSTNDVSGVFGNSFDCMISPTEAHRRAWVVPEDIVANGLNDLTLEFSSDRSINVIYIDIGIPN